MAHTKAAAAAAAAATAVDVQRVWPAATARLVPGTLRCGGPSTEQHGGRAAGT